MRKSIHLETLAAFEDVARFDVSTCSDIPTIILGHGSAGNDATCDDPATAANDTEPWAPRKIILAVIDAFRVFARQAHARRQQRRNSGAIYDALRDLDDRTLHDLGLDRSEITSIAAEVTGRAEPARVRALLMSHTLP
jgi:uncharacterized protein YjiS (DUF1127 family)